MKESTNIFFKKKNYGSIKSNKIKLVNEFKVSIHEYKFHSIVYNKCQEKWFEQNRVLGRNFFLDSNFSKVSHKLIPNKIYKIRIFRIGEWVNESISHNMNWGTSMEGVATNDCINFLKEQKAYLIGMKGLMLLDDYIDKKILKSKPLISLDEKENMVIGSLPRIPLLGFDFEKYYSICDDSLFDPGVHILSVTDME